MAREEGKGNSLLCNSTVTTRIRHNHLVVRMGLLSPLRHPSATLAFLFVGAIYLWLTLLCLPTRFFYVGDQGTKWLQIENLVAKRWSNLSLDYPGDVLDPEHRFTPLVLGCFEQGGQIYQKYSLAYALAGSLFYVAFGAVGVPLLSAFSTLGTMLLVYSLGRRTGLTPLLSTLAAIALGLATPLFFYSVDLGESMPNVFLATLSIWLCSAAWQRDSRWLWLAAGGTAGATIWLRPEMYFFLLATLLAYITASWKKWHIAGLTSYPIGAGLAILPLWIFQQSRYGSFLGPHLTYELTRGHLRLDPLSLGGSLLQAETIKTFLRLRGFFLALLYPWPSWPWAIVGSLPVVALALARMLPERYRLSVRAGGILAGLLGVCVLAIQNLRAMNSPLDLTQSFPLLAVLFILLLPGWPGTERPDRLLRFMAYTALLFSLFICLFGVVRGGTQWGPRLLLPAFPALTLLVVHTWQQLGREKGLGRWRSAFMALFLALFVLSLATQATGIGRLFLTKTYYAHMGQIVASDPAEVVVADHPWAIQAVASVFSYKPMFLVQDRAQTDALLALLSAQGIKRLLCITMRPSGSKDVSGPLLPHPQLREEGHYSLPAIADSRWRDRAQELGLWEAFQRISLSRASIYLFSSCELVARD